MHPNINSKQSLANLPSAMSSSQAPSNDGSDGMGRSNSVSPQSSLNSGSDSHSSCNGSSPTRHSQVENRSGRNGNASSLAARSAVTLPPIHPSRRGPNNNNYGMRVNNSNDGAIFDRDLSFIYGSSGSALTGGNYGRQSQSVLNSIRGSPTTWNHTELVQAILQNNDTLIAWMKEMNLLVKSWSCPKCTSPMAWETIPLGGPKTVDRYQWRCPRRSCSLTIHLRSSSFFDRPFYVTLASFIEIIYWWAKGAPMAFVVEETGCGMEFLGYAFCLIREVCGLMVNDFVVGGPGAVTGYTDALKLTINGMVCETYLGTMQESEQKWRRKYGSQAFQNILDHIAVVYDFGGLQSLRGNLNSYSYSGKGNTMEWRADSRADQRSLNDSFRAEKNKGFCGTANETQTAWKSEAPSLWESSRFSDYHDNLRHTFNEDQSQELKPRRS